MIANKIQVARRAIMKSSYLVCLQGHDTSTDRGCFDYRDSNAVYDIEEKYGYSSEEMFHAGFYNTRPEQFFKYYKQEVLGHIGTPGKGALALAELERRGILKCIITREIFSLARRGGCENVVELHGSIFQNICSHCWKEYPMEYIIRAKGVPLCEKCHRPVRPQVCLVGEQVDNARVTRAAEKVEKADVLLLLGCTMNQKLVTTHLKYFDGNKVILINPEEHFSDINADSVIHGKAEDILPRIVYGDRKDDERE